jgi:tetratricopeptide (TPR) repeat protein
MRPGNPYIAGNPVGTSHAFVGRDDVLRNVLDLLCDPQHHGVVLYGQRRIGKTSILQHLKAWLPANGGPRAIYFDLQDKASLPIGTIMAQLAAAIANELDLPDPEPTSKPEAWFRDTWLPSVFAGLAANESLAVLLDEFDVLADAESQRAASATFFRYLRDLLEKTTPRLKFVFVIGRNLEDLSYLAGPLFKTLPSDHISLLLQPEAEHLVRMSERNGSLPWNPEAIEKTWALTRGHPYLLQHLCWQIWQRAQAGDRADRAVTAEDVEAAVPHTLKASLNALEWLWGGLPPAGRVVASALAKAGTGAISEEALQQVLHESGVRVVIRELRDAPQLLSEWDILEAEDGGYRFRVELLRQWIAKFKPLSRVQEELDRIEPLAEVLYKAGEGFFKAGNLNGAMAQLRQAIGINPNHLRANELVAEILISKSDWDEAQQVLEKLHEMHPAAARPRLVQVLLAQASLSDDEDRRVELYEQVLALDERNAEAFKGSQKIWTARGDRARGGGRLEQAVVAYRKAGLIERAKEVDNELRAQELPVVEKLVHQLEATEQYEAALEEIRKTEDRFVGLKDWTEDRLRIGRSLAMVTNYLLAIDAVENGDPKTATKLLADIVGSAPTYKDSAKYLYEAVSGVEVDRLLQAEQHAKSAEAAWKMQLAEAEKQAKIAEAAQEQLETHVRLADAATASLEERNKQIDLEAEMARASLAESRDKKLFRDNVSQKVSRWVLIPWSITATVYALWLGLRSPPPTNLQPLSIKPSASTVSRTAEPDSGPPSTPTALPSASPACPGGSRAGDGGKCISDQINFKCRELVGCDCAPGDLMCAMKCSARPATPPTERIPRGFDCEAARAALQIATDEAKKCGNPEGPWGTCTVEITFMPKGTVQAKLVAGADFRGTPVEACVIGKFQGAKRPPFNGEPVLATSSFTMEPP